MTSSIILLALVKSNNAQVIPGGPEVLLGSNFRAVPTKQAQRANGVPESPSSVIGGKLKRVLHALWFWEEESPDLRKARKLLEGMAEEVIAGMVQE